MIPEMFQAKGTFWRGNIHTHSDRSDGVLTPEEVCRRYQAEGYDFLALTDHFVGLFNYPITKTNRRVSKQTSGTDYKSLVSGPFRKYYWAFFRSSKAIHIP